MSRSLSIFLTLLCFLLAGVFPAHGKLVFPRSADEADEAGKTKTYHYDQAGSAIARTDDAGRVIGRAEYSAYGLTVWKDGDMKTPFLFNGQAGVTTEASGLLCMRARYYSPYLMRFVNADPSGFGGGSNWYAYADGNPVSNTDPFGLCADSHACTGGTGTGAPDTPVPQWMRDSFDGAYNLWYGNAKTREDIKSGKLIVSDMGIAGLFNPAGELGAAAEVLEAAKGGVSAIPESYMNARHLVDMEPARGLVGSTLNAGGEVRNAGYFWQQLIEREPQMFSKGNLYKIEELGRSPKVDATWLEYNPTHQSFLNDVLHHHHIGQGPIAVPLPASVHQGWTSILH